MERMNYSTSWWLAIGSLHGSVCLVRAPSPQVTPSCAFTHKTLTLLAAFVRVSHTHELTTVPQDLMSRYHGCGAGFRHMSVGKDILAITPQQSPIRVAGTHFLLTIRLMLKPRMLSCCLHWPWEWVKESVIYNSLPHISAANQFLWLWSQWTYFLAVIKGTPCYTCPSIKDKAILSFYFLLKWSTYQMFCAFPQSNERVHIAGKHHLRRWECSRSEETRELKSQRGRSLSADLQLLSPWRPADSWRLYLGSKSLRLALIRKQGGYIETLKNQQTK